MSRPNRKRTERSPVTVRMSPGELDSLAEKAIQAGLGTISAAVRAAVDAWVPRIETLHVEPTETASNEIKRNTLLSAEGDANWDDHLTTNDREVQS